MRFRLQTELKQHYPVHYINAGQAILVSFGKNATPVVIHKPSEDKTLEIQTPDVINVEQASEMHMAVVVDRSSENKSFTLQTVGLM